MVSVIIVTFNSASFITETLESVKRQTYMPIELIVSDDGSTDDTMTLVKEWTRINRNRFTRTEILTTDKNSGTPANLNRGLSASKGLWLKYCAGDDLLSGNCISDNIDFVSANPDASFVFSNGLTIDENGVQTGTIKSDGRKLSHDITGQYREMLKSSFVLTPSAFIRRESLITLGGYDERSRFLEDYPMWLKALRNGYRLYYLDKETVCYRKHSKGASLNLKNRSSFDKRIKWMETVSAVYDDKVVKDIFRFRMYGLYLNILFTRRAYEGWKSGNKTKFRFYSVLRMIEPSHLIKQLRRNTLIRLSQLKNLFSGNGKK